MTESEFYNRVKETDEIISCINAQENENRILILAGKTGVGKSGLVRMILGNKLRDRRSIQVSISKSSPDTIENLHYINAIYRTFVKLANEHLFDGILSPQQQGITSIKRLFSFGVKVLWSKTAGSENVLYEPVDEGSVLRKRDYIVSLLKRHHFIINIENIQNIDSQSFEILNDIIQQVDHTTFILEYTLSEENGLEQFYSFYNELLTFHAEVFSFRIEALDFEEARKLAPVNTSESKLRAIYRHSEGNLVKMLLSSSIMTEDVDPIQFKLSELSKNEKFIVDVIFLNDGIELSLLYRLLLNGNPSLPFSQQAIDDDLYKLRSYKIIEYRSNGIVHIAHDSINKELEVQPANSLLFIAFHILKEYYLAQLHERPDEETIEHLLQLMIKFSDEDILHIFPYIRQLIRSYKYRQSVITKLSHFREILTQKGTTNFCTLYELSLSMVVLCIELGFDKEAQKNLDLVYDKSNAYHRALQVAIYTLDFTNESSMKQAELLAQKATTPRERLIMELSLLSGKMARLPTDESLHIVRTLMDSEVYHELFEYAYLLRDYAELAPNYDESIRIYGQVLRHFRNTGREDLCSQVLVAVSMFFAYKGNLKVARRLLNKAAEGNVSEHHILNNQAVIDMLENAASVNSASALNDALLISGDPYENLIIRCNLLVCYTLLGDKARAEMLCNSIVEEDYAIFEYEEFLHIVYQDLYYYHFSFNNLDKAEFYKNRISSLLNNLSAESMAYRVASLQLVGEPSDAEFYSNFPFRVDFLGNWNLEISRDLEHY